jgi:hypothetical protein
MEAWRGLLVIRTYIEKEFSSTVELLWIPAVVAKTALYYLSCAIPFLVNFKPTLFCTTYVASYYGSGPLNNEDVASQHLEAHLTNLNTYLIISRIK